MSTATATVPSTVSHRGGEAKASGFQNRIIAYCFENGIEITNGKARKLGIRLARRAQSMQSEFDFYESLRVLGIHTDSTARDAIKNLEVSHSHKE